MVEGKCSGKCCTAFCLPLTHEEIAAGVLKRRGYPDADLITGMLVPLTKEEAAERFRRLWGNDAKPLPGEAYPELHKIFTCKYWSEESHLCTIYEKRPGMCRDYPYFLKMVDGVPLRVCEYGCGYTITEKKEEAKK